MTAAVVAVNAQGNSTSPSTAASPASSASKLQAKQALTPAASYEDFGNPEILNPSPFPLHNIIIINGYYV